MIAERSHSGCGFKRWCVWKGLASRPFQPNAGLLSAYSSVKSPESCTVRVQSMWARATGWMPILAWVETSKSSQIFPSLFLMPNSHLTIKVFNIFGSKLPFERVPLLISTSAYMLMIIKFLSFSKIYQGFGTSTCNWLLGLSTWKVHRLITCSVLELQTPSSRAPARPPRLPDLAKGIAIASIAGIDSEAQSHSHPHVPVLCRWHSAVMWLITVNLSTKRAVAIHGDGPRGSEPGRSLSEQLLPSEPTVSIWTDICLRCWGGAGRRGGQALKPSQAILPLPATSWGRGEGTVRFYHHLQMKILTTYTVVQGRDAGSETMRFSPGLLMSSPVFFLVDRGVPWTVAYTGRESEDGSSCSCTASCPGSWVGPGERGV